MASELRWTGAEPSMRFWLDHASAVLDTAGIATPRFDAERIAAHAYGLSWSELQRGVIDDPFDRCDVESSSRAARRASW